MGAEFVDWKSTLLSVIPAQAGIQVFFDLVASAKMDAGLRRHDKTSLLLKARDFKHPRNGTLEFSSGMRVFRKDHLGSSDMASSSHLTDRRV